MPKKRSLSILMGILETININTILDDVLLKNLSVYIFFFYLGIHKNS